MDYLTVTAVEDVWFGDAIKRHVPPPDGRDGRAYDRKRIDKTRKSRLSVTRSHDVYNIAISIFFYFGNRKSPRRGQEANRVVKRDLPNKKLNIFSLYTQHVLLNKKIYVNFTLGFENRARLTRCKLSSDHESKPEWHPSARFRWQNASRRRSAHGERCRKHFF